MTNSDRGKLSAAPRASCAISRTRAARTVRPYGFKSGFWQAANIARTMNITTVVKASMKRASARRALLRMQAAYRAYLGGAETA
jgi:hypothetical protein